MFPVLKGSPLVFKIQRIHRESEQYMSNWNITHQSKKIFYTDSKIVIFPLKKGVLPT